MAAGPEPPPVIYPATIPLPDITDNEDTELDAIVISPRSPAFDWWRWSGTPNLLPLAQHKGSPRREDQVHRLPMRGLEFLYHRSRGERELWSQYGLLCRHLISPPLLTIPYHNPSTVQRAFNHVPLFRFVSHLHLYYLGFSTVGLYYTHRCIY